MDMSMTLDGKLAGITVAIYNSPDLAHESYLSALRHTYVKIELDGIGEEAFIVTGRPCGLHIRMANSIIHIQVMADSETLFRELARGVLEKLEEG